MLRFTGAGIVPSPTVLQVRVTKAFPGRVAAGAPEPARSLADGEIAANLKRFTIERGGPRATPCTSLVLSGVDLEERVGLADLVRQGRAWGVRHVTLHLGHGDRERLARSPLAGCVDAVALTVSTEADARDAALLAATGVHTSAVVLLDVPTLAELPALIGSLAAASPDRVVFTWPFPPASPPPEAITAARAVRDVLRLLDEAGVASGVKGLPVCVLGDLPLDRHWRSGNRWYVDADHQLDDALLFFPDVVRFAKAEDCRFCDLAERCDGVPEAWYQRGLAGRLRPLGPDGEPR